MKNFTKLVNFEFNRFLKLYVTLLIIVYGIQTAGVLFHTFKFKKLTNDIVMRGEMTELEFTEMYGVFSMEDFTMSILYTLPIYVGIAAIAFYAFFIWYRDWFAKHTFIYRLLTLPTQRMNIYLAKLTTMLLITLGYAALQIVMIAFHSKLTKWIIPQAFRYDYSLYESVNLTSQYSLVLTGNAFDFFITYAFILTAIIVIFTAVLFERSYRWKGLVIGIVYAFIIFLLIVVPFTVMFLFYYQPRIYPEEALFIQLGIMLIIVVTSLFISRHLMNKKVSV